MFSLQAVLIYLGWSDDQRDDRNFLWEKLLQAYDNLIAYERGERPDIPKFFKPAIVQYLRYQYKDITAFWRDVLSPKWNSLRAEQARREMGVKSLSNVTSPQPP